MAKVKDTDLYVAVLKPDSSKCSIKFDDDLDALLDGQGIEDLDEKKLVFDALCALGLAERKMFSEHTDTLDSQEYHYTSTKAMRKLAKEWLYGGKHLFDWAQ